MPTWGKKSRVSLSSDNLKGLQIDPSTLTINTPNLYWLKTTHNSRSPEDDIAPVLYKKGTKEKEQASILFSLYESLNFIHLYFIFGCTGSSLLLSGFLYLQGEWELLSRCSAQTFPVAEVQILGCAGPTSAPVERRLSSCDAQAQLPCGMWTLSRSDREPTSSTLGERFLTTGPPGQSPLWIFIHDTWIGPFHERSFLTKF